VSLRVRLAITTIAVAVPMVVGLVWLDARSRHRAAEEMLARIATDRLSDASARTRCEADPTTWGLRHPDHGPGPDDRPPLGPPPGDRPDHGLPSPPPLGIRAAPPVFFIYDRALHSAASAAPRLAPQSIAALGQRPWMALSSSTFGESIAVLVRTPWADGPCAFVLVRGSSPRGFLGALLPASKFWMAPLVAMLIAVLIAIGPTVESIRRLTVTVRESAATGFVTPPPAIGRGEIRELGQAFGAASIEVRRQLAARDDRERALREYLANTTHDVMIPLTVLSQHLASLRAGDRASDPAVVDDIVARAMDEAHYLAAMIHNLSVAAKLDVVEPQLERTRVDLNRLVARVIARHRPIASERGIQLDSGVPEVPVFIDADLTMIEQAISNLVYNAIRYNLRGGHVAVVLDRDTRRFSLRVLDDGPGIPPADLGSLITRGFRSDAARTRSTGGHGGHGIGLHITHTVARLHDFTLNFRNADGAGLEVAVTGPIVDDA
jgi:two-component system, OmpR family, sensor histidine kinase BaeS